MSIHRPLSLSLALSLGLGLTLGLGACSGDDGRGTSASGTATAAGTVSATATTSSGSEGSSSGSGSSGGGGSETGTGDGTSSTGAATVTDTATTGTSTSTSTSTTTGDPTTGGDTTTGGPEGCKRVDFLFVIDNSVSMEGEQAALKAAFPEFIDTIKNTLPTNDYHIMVVDTDAEGRCSPQVCTHATCQAANKYACKDIFTACDTTRGAGVIHPAGDFASNMLCQLEGGNRYILSSDPNLNANFSCVASVGTAGHPSERPMDGMVEAVSPALEGPGGCNEGFLRDDAILVVTFISDDPNVEDLNTAQQTHDALVAAKGGDEDRIVMLGLIPIPEDGCGKGGAHWAQMISLFGERGIKGPVCSNDYNGFFLDAVSTILDTCVINPG
ncbi:MAG: hypothetical protein H6710_16805 [Myxococcales bacterium]|nr:hypothetical protein [Myxococcales bacterium]MCB9704855.1 hypothetical protein [Myxococcales bacterium]